MDEKRKKLVREIYEWDKKAEKNKLKRSVYTILMYVVANTFILYILFNELNGNVDFEQIIAILIISVVFSVISFIANTIIFSQLIEKVRGENERLKALERKLEEFDKENNIEKKFIVEDFLKNRNM